MTNTMMVDIISIDSDYDLKHMIKVSRGKQARVGVGSDIANIEYSWPIGPPQNIKKSELAQKMGTSRSFLERLLREEQSSVTLNTISKAALVLGKRVDISLVYLQPQKQNAQER